MAVLVVLAGASAWGQSTPAASAASAAAPATALRVELLGPLRAAQDLISQKRFDEAMAQIRLADGAGVHSADEVYLVERLRAAAAGGLRDGAAALRALEAALASGQGTPAERAVLMAASASTAFVLKDHARSARWAKAYVEAGGPNEQVRLLWAQSSYLDGAYVEAVRVLDDLLASQRAADRRPAPKQLELHASALLKSGDGAGHDRVVELMLATEPTPALWADRLSRLATAPGFDNRLLIDVLRLGLTVGAWTDAAPYVQLAELSLNAGYVHEARQVVDAGFAAGVLGQGGDAASHGKLRERIARQVEADRRNATATDAVAMAGKDGPHLFSTGYHQYTAGRIETGLALMEQGLLRGIAQRSGDARLRLGMAYARSRLPAHRARAQEVLSSLAGQADLTTTADLSRLLLLALAR